MSKYSMSQQMRALVILSGAGQMYNDRLQPSETENGGRSFKVPGWTKKQFKVAKEKMKEFGYSAKIVTTPTFDKIGANGGGGGVLRLHVRTK